MPTFTAFVVTRLLEQHLEWLIDYDFTARMENRLDEIAAGDINHLEVLKGFYHGDSGLVGSIKHAEDTADPRQVCGVSIGFSEKKEEIQVRVGRYGEFLKKGEVNASLPDQIAPDELSLGLAIELLEKQEEGPKVLGTDPETGKPVYLKEGRFGTHLFSLVILKRFQKSEERAQKSLSRKMRLCFPI